MNTLLIIALAVSVFGLSTAQFQAATFTEVTSQAGLEVRDLDKVAAPGIGDLNQDGFLDFVYSNHARGPAKVYYGRKSGKFDKYDVFLNKTDKHAVCVGDYDNDGRPDMILVNGGVINVQDAAGQTFSISRVAPTIARSRSRRRGDFEEISGDDLGLKPEIAHGQSSYFGSRYIDVDLDGNLDLFLHSLNGNHQIFRNVGGRFEFVPEAGIKTKLGIGFLVTDYNNDGYMDVIDYRKGIQIFRNNGNFVFTDVSREVLPSEFKAFIFSSAAEIDYDNDGDFDLYFSGGLKLKANARVANDVFLVNNGDGTYSDQSRAVRLPRRGTHMGITVADFNNDGFVDVFIPRAGPTDQRISDLLLVNTGSPTRRKFVAVETHGANGPLDGSDTSSGVGAQAFDYNKDGKVDLVVTSRNHPFGGIRLFQNNSPNVGNYIIVEVPVKVFRGSTMDSIVRVTTRKSTFMRRVGSVGEGRVQSFIDQVHFGLGSARRVLKLELTLPNGRSLTLMRPPINTLVTINK